MNSISIVFLIFSILNISTIKAQILASSHCSSFDDPHIRSFQVKKFEFHRVGVQNFYNDQLGVDIDLTYQRCPGQPKYTCNSQVKINLQPYFYATFASDSDGKGFVLNAGPDVTIKCPQIRIADTDDMFKNVTLWGRRGVFNTGDDSTNFKCYRARWGLYVIRSTLPQDNKVANDVMIYIYTTRATAKKSQTIDGVKLYPSSYYMKRVKGKAPHDIDTSLCGKNYKTSRADMRPELQPSLLEACENSLLDSCIKDNFGYLLHHYKEDINDAIEHCALDHSGDPVDLKIGHFQERYVEKKIIESIYKAHGTLKLATDKIASFCKCRGLEPEPCLIEYKENCPETVGLCIEKEED